MYICSVLSSTIIPPVCSLQDIECQALPFLFHIIAYFTHILKEKGADKVAKRIFLNFLYKIILFPGGLYLLSVVFPQQIAFGSVQHWLYVSLLLLIIGLVADEIVLGMFGIYRATLQGAVAIGAILYLSGWLFMDSHITILGSILCGIILGILEFIMHRYVRTDQKKRKFRST
ncbi:Uncharacterized protein BN1090_A2_00056 [Aneurinibacillus migulanus]|nr:Uncharacterized protein BN1090_A2_00056 [Aneurinibacillus migulanus]